jgi:hypothetical protein
MMTIKRSTLRLLSVVVGLLFVAGIYYTMHFRMGWDWNAPGLGRLPQEVVQAYLKEAYDEGKGAQAVRDFVAPAIAEDSTPPQERADGPAIPRHVRATLAQGLNVVVFQSLAPARSLPAADVIDVFEVRDGRIVHRERYQTSFVGNAGSK